jgi:hypothetical protein
VGTRQLFIKKKIKAKTIT